MIEMGTTNGDLSDPNGDAARLAEMERAAAQARDEQAQARQQGEDGQE